ncbi:thioredoxin family protein [Dorcoceras hygrometricum]|uniref:Thioredoxin family protein n=1 Tax=Dorcoceras hygrometricum TaxID=472368 RepID=A0A2Z7BEC6_9LAMI|nr:thioredoxin family protein [Dorcoceras hygrometricum]
MTVLPLNSGKPRIGYPRMSASGESSTTMHRLLHASGSHPIPTPYDPNIGYPRKSASGESSTTMHRLLHASGSHPIPTPYDPKTNQYNQDLRLIHSTNGNHLESPNEGSSIDHQVTIYLHAQNITMFPTNETRLIKCGGCKLVQNRRCVLNQFGRQLEQCAEGYQNNCKMDKGTVAAEFDQADQHTAKLVQQRRAKLVVRKGSDLTRTPMAEGPRD